ncbi:MAG TPA: FlhC family transcriptional regulator [Povalibacter sp.]|uniref:hypothetical protein n=1 Tax=Povalibacter sp. TaxID=1962978 RepID=UPI002C3D26E0|nr:hypothetical protein [Povalibacter sp.]HMN43823.1 FlhC family transcriptional regulator [Povalibacter sp.]
MAAPTHADRAQWEFRQTRLAYRLLCAEARTQTICRFTSLSPHRLAKWRKRWGFSDTDRSRGPAPNSFTPFFRFPALRAEGAYLAILCRTFGVLGDDHAGSANSFYRLATGERLCDLLEFHRQSYQAPSISFDQLLLLARGLQTGKSIQLSHCSRCGGGVLRDPFQLVREGCDACRRPRQSHPAPARATHENVVRRHLE